MAFVGQAEVSGSAAAQSPPAQSAINGLRREIGALLAQMRPTALSTSGVRRVVGGVGVVTAAAALAVTGGGAGTLPVGTLALDGPATPEQIALVLPVTGSLTQAATATCRYRTTAGPGAWLTGHPLYRVRPSLNPSPDFGGSIQDVFAWTILGLTPGTSYDVEVTVSDGVTTNIKNLTTTTRALPAASGATTVSVAAGSTAAQIASAINGAAPGAVITIQGNCNITGSININSGGTLASPKYVRGLTRAVTITRTNAPGNLLSLGGNIGHIVFEDLTLAGNGVDEVVPTPGAAVASDTALKTNITFRRLTITGINRGFHITNGNGCLYYDCTMTGNDLWSTTPVNFLDDITWQDDCVMLAGQGNCIFNCTLKGFGDTFAYTSHAEGDVTAINCHAWRNDVRNSCDDLCEFDHARRNCTMYDNRVHNCMSSESFDPSQGGPFIIARNIIVNQAAYTVFKWNDGGAGYFTYNNTICSPTSDVRQPLQPAWWVKFNDGLNDSYGMRNNIFILPAGLADNMIVQSIGHDNIDWTHNSWNRDFGLQFDGQSWATLAAAQSGIGNRTPVFGSLHSPNNRPFNQDNISAVNPFVQAVTMGATSSVEVTATYTPVVAAGQTPKNSGVVIPNITDGFSGAAPDRGAVIEGRPLVVYGDRTVFPAWFSALSPLTWATPLTNALQSAGVLDPLANSTNSGSSGPASIVGAWCGMAIDQVRRTAFMVRNGGHNDYYGNEVYELDFRQNPLSWNRPRNSTSNPGGISPAGSPRSAHTYSELCGRNGFWYSPLTGSGAPQGFDQSNRGWLYNRDTGAYTDLGIIGAQTAVGDTQAVYDPAGDRILLVSQTSLRVYAINPTTGGLTLSLSQNHSLDLNGGEATISIDTTRNVMLVQHATSSQCFSWNLANLGQGFSTFTPSGTRNLTRSQMTWHPPSQAFLGWGGLSQGIRKLVCNTDVTGRYTSGTFSTVAVSGTGPTSLPYQGQGTYGRVNLVDMGGGEWLMVVVWRWGNPDTSVIRIQGAV